MFVGGAAPVQVSLSRTQEAAVAGRAWTARLAVRPASYTGAVHVTATGALRIAATATGAHGAYRARFVFPSAGRWMLTARAGGSTSLLGSVQVRAPAKVPLAFAWPTGIDVEPDGSLLVVENGSARVLRVDPATGNVRVLSAGIPKAYAVARTPSGVVYVTGNGSLWRLDARGTPQRVLDAGADAGPLAAGADGDVFFATATSVYRLSAGAGTAAAIASQLSDPHGLAVAADGTVLVSDTGTGRVLRIDPGTHAISTFALIGEPRGIDIAPDGTVAVVDARTHGVVHLSATGRALGVLSTAFGDPYALAVAPDGALYVVDTAESGHVLRIATDGTVTTLSRRD